MKAILVVDKPTCEECPCYHEDRSVCQAGGLYGKPCPLRPLPTKKEHSEEDNPYSDNYEDEYEYQYREGYNTCLREITGDTE